MIELPLGLGFLAIICFIIILFLLVLRIQILKDINKLRKTTKKKFKTKTSDNFFKKLIDSRITTRKKILWKKRSKMPKELKKFHKKYMVLYIINIILGIIIIGFIIISIIFKILK